MADLGQIFCDKPNESILTKLAKEELDSSEAVVSFVKGLLLNPIFASGILLSFLGFLWLFAQRAIDFVKALFNQYFFQSLEITNENVAYTWVMEHINKHSRVKTQNLSVESKYDSEDGSLEHKFIPGTGSHYFYYQDRWIYFERSREKRNVDIDNDLTHTYRSAQLEIVTLSTYQGSPEFWQQFLDDATKAGLDEVQKGLQVYHAQNGDYWNAFGKPRRKRDLDSVVLQNGLSNSIYEDVKDFLASAKWYNDRGVPYRRGYLLYGPPGTGKSSFISALASHFGYGISFLSLNERFMDDSKLNYLINNATTKTFILLEDIDAALAAKDRGNSEEPDKADTTSSAVTLSGLLNAIDGVASSEERIIFMTTNYKEKLDAALIRPGRIDFEAYFGHCTPDMVEKMFQRFYETVSDEQVKEFVEKTSKDALGKTFSPAELQRHLILFKTCPQKAIDNVNMI